MSGDLKLSLVVQASTEQARKALADLQRAEQDFAKAAATGGQQASEALSKVATAAKKAQQAINETRSIKESLDIATAGAHGLDEALQKTAHSSTAARRELIVLAHELSQGNYSRFGGSLMVLAEQTDLLGKIMSPTGLAIAAVVGTIGALAVAAAKGANEIARLHDIIRLTGDAAGVTQGDYEAMANGLATSTSSKIGTVREVLQALIETGRYTRETVQPVARAVLDVANASNQSAEDVLKDFVKMRDGVSQWAQEHNRQYHFLTLAQLEHIEQLEREGKVSEAVQETAGLLSRALEDQKQPVTGLARVWHGLTGVISEAWDAMKRIGRPATLEQQIKAADQGLAALRQDLSRTSGMNPNDLPAYRDLMAKRAQLVEQLHEQQNKAVADSEKAAHIEEQIEAKKHLDSLLSTYAAGRKKLEEQEIAVIRREAASQNGQPGAPSAADVDAMIQSVRDKYAPKTATTHGAVTARDDASNQIRVFKAQLDTQLALLGAAVASRTESEAQALADSRQLWAAHYASVTSILQGALAKAKTPAEKANLSSQLQAVKAEAITKDTELQKQLTELTRRGENDRAQILSETSKKAGDVRAAELAKVEASYHDWIDKLRKDGIGDWQQLADDWRTQQLRAVNVEDLKRQIDQVEQTLSRTQTRVQVQIEAGSITKQQGNTELQQASAHAREELVALQAKLKEVLDVSPDDESLKRLFEDVGLEIEKLPIRAKTPMEQMLDQWSDTTSAMQEMTRNWLDRGVDALAQFAATGKLNFRQLLQEMQLDIVRSGLRSGIAQIFSAMGGGGSASAGASLGGAGIAGLLGSLFGGGGTAAAASGSTATGPAAFNIGTGEGSIAASLGLALASGGAVQGPGTGTSDSIPAMLSHGEYVLRADAVRRVGVDFLDRLNGGQLPSNRMRHFATGGLVSAAGVGSVAAASAPQSIFHMPVTVMAPEGRISRQTDLQLRTAVAQSVAAAMRRN